MKDEKSAPNDAKQKPKGVRIEDDIKTVIFDLDGTMYDKRGLAARMVSRLWWSLPLLAAERFARRNAHYVQFASEEEFFRFFFITMSRGHWWGPRIAEKWYHMVYLPTMVRMIHRYHHIRPQVLELLRVCRKKQLQMAIYSDYGSVIEKLEALDIDPAQFDLVISAPELGALKPSEPCARRVLEMLGAKPETTLFVGDREDKDGASAKAVGARFLLIN
ncbi:MAG: HAD family hydrolase [Paludibacteraceae bacterium]|nr:HAD family hydrolase [Paludibacteraceae bacterium]